MTESLLLLLPLALAFVVLIGALFWWAIFSGQFDDTHKAGESILHDDDSFNRHAKLPEPESSSKAQNTVEMQGKHSE